MLRYNKKLKKIFFCICCCCLLLTDTVLFAQNQIVSKEKHQRKKYHSKKRKEKFRINTGSFAYHLRRLRGSYTEYFDNHLFALGIRTGSSTFFQFGSFLNSHGARGVVIGIQKKWYDFSPKLCFEGAYAYVGEFFFGILSDSNFGSEGTYVKIREATGIPWGWAPYIYHGLKYDLFPFLSLQGGYMIGHIIIFGLQWNIFDL